jgi:hypothetical protein
VAEGNWRLIRLRRIEAEEYSAQVEGNKRRSRESDDGDGDGDGDDGGGGGGNLDLKPEEFNAALMLMSAGMSGSRLPVSLLRGLTAKPAISMDPYGPARGRVELSISRAMRELRALRKGKEEQELPSSPYLGDEEPSDDCDEMEDPQNEPTAAESSTSADRTETSGASAVRTMDVDGISPQEVGTADPTREAGADAQVPRTAPRPPISRAY